MFVNFRSDKQELAEISKDSVPLSDVYECFESLPFEFEENQYLSDEEKAYLKRLVMDRWNFCYSDAHEDKNQSISFGSLMEKLGQGFRRSPPGVLFVSELCFVRTKLFMGVFHSLQKNNSLGKEKVAKLTLSGPIRLCLMITLQLTWQKLMTYRMNLVIQTMI